MALADASGGLTDHLLDQWGKIQDALGEQF
jgi:hypothetical protein